MTAAKSDRSAAAIQRATAEEDVKSGTVVTGKKDEALVVKLRDNTFKVADELGAMALFEWAAASELSTDDLAGLAAIHAMLEDVLHEDDWKEFRHFARTARPKVTADELIQVINDATELISGRPTKQPSGSASTPS